LEQKVVIVGIGAAGAVHAKALEDVLGVVVVAGVDSSSRVLEFRGNKVPVYPSLFDMMSEGAIHPDTIVVATPTSTHAQVCSEVSEYFRQASIIVEKPAADTMESAQHLVCGIGGKQSLTVAYHMAFSPEVEWGMRESVERAPELGVPVSIEAWGADPYQSDLAAARARFGNSWIDSGINALSVIDRFAKPIRRTSLRRLGDPSKSVFEGTFVCEFDGRQLPATILTSWYSTASSRWTKIKYSTDAEVVMDHNAVAGYIRQGGQVCALFGSDGTIPRREAHYRALYKSWLANKDDRIFSLDTSLRFHELLLGGDN
jgi:predicted dehydrogenase